MRGITLLVEDPNWLSHRGLQARLKKAAQAARRAARMKSGFAILLAGDKKLRALNHEFRGKNKPTNVLSFPAGDGHGGDIAIAYGVTAKEAKTAGKSFADHASHLVVHGVLHLAGYDHQRPKDAKVMEPLETRILARLGIADPYRMHAP
ncbi:MAG TPA: rRNA maturation RNase YbeY [Rhizomicrobium sp.]|nr:rRNA maturation RNase YbeY [Rhizomicrobium sp.]